MLRRAGTLRPSVLCTATIAWTAFPTAASSLAGFTPTSLFARAQDCITAGGFEAALGFLDLIKQRTEAVDYLKALCFLRLKDPIKARAALRAEVMNYPKNEDAVDLLGRVNASLKRSVPLPQLILESEPIFAEFYHTFAAKGSSEENDPTARALMWPRLFSLYCHAKELCENGVDGDFVVCAKVSEYILDIAPSSALLLGMVAKAYEIPQEMGAPPRKRNVYLYNTYDGPAVHSLASCAKLEMLSSKLGVEVIHVNGSLASTVQKKGFHQSSAHSPLHHHHQEVGEGNHPTQLPDTDNQIALLHLDCEWYHEADAAMRFLFPRVAVGGVVQIEELNFWDGCKLAVTEHLTRRGIAPSKVLHKVDANAMWMRKE